MNAMLARARADWFRPLHPGWAILAISTDSFMDSIRPHEMVKIPEQMALTCIPALVATLPHPDGHVANTAGRSVAQIVTGVSARKVDNPMALGQEPVIPSLAPPPTLAAGQAEALRAAAQLAASQVLLGPELPVQDPVQHQSSRALGPGHTVLGQTTPMAPAPVQSAPILLGSVALSIGHQAQHGIAARMDEQLHPGDSFASLPSPQVGSLA